LVKEWNGKGDRVAQKLTAFSLPVCVRTRTGRQTKKQLDIYNILLFITIPMRKYKEKNQRGEKWQRNGVGNWKLELFEYLRSSTFSHFCGYVKIVPMKMVKYEEECGVLLETVKESPFANLSYLFVYGCLWLHDLWLHDLAKRLGITLAAVSYAVKRGEEIVKLGGYLLVG